MEAHGRYFLKLQGDMILQELRLIKSPSEQHLMRTAGQIAAEGFRMVHFLGIFFFRIIDNMHRQWLLQMIQKLRA